MSDNHTPLFSRLCKTAEANAIRFHMPGHKGKPVFPDGVLPESIDYTELPATGNLYENSSPFCELNELFSRDYGAAKSFVLVGGATQGICAMIACAYSGRKDKTIVCERSATGAYTARWRSTGWNRYICTHPFARRPLATQPPILTSARSVQSLKAPMPRGFDYLSELLRGDKGYPEAGALSPIPTARCCCCGRGARRPSPYLENRCSAISQGADVGLLSAQDNARARRRGLRLNSSDAFDSETIRFFSVFGSSSPRISYLRRRIWQGRISIPNGESSAIRCTARRKSGKDQ